MSVLRSTAYPAGQLVAASERVGERTGRSTDDIKVLP